MKWVLDRFEGSKAVLENIDTRETTVCDREALPPEAQEGDVLLKIDGSYTIDRPETKNRAEDIRARFELIKRHR